MIHHCGKLYQHAPRSSTMLQFALNILRGRYFMIFASTLVMAATGGTYNFGIYSKAIKASLHYDQGHLNMLAFSKNLGASIGLVSGLLNQASPPWMGLALGAGTNLVGHLMTYLAVTGRTARPPFGLVFLYAMVGASSQPFATTAALVTAVNNFPDNRGLVLGLLTGFAGLSGAIFAQLHRAFDGANDDGAELLLLMAWLPAAVYLLLTRAIRIIPRNAAAAAAGTARGRERKALLHFIYASVLLAVYLLAMNVVEATAHHLPKPAYHVAVGVPALLLLLVIPLHIVVKHGVETNTTEPAAATIIVTVIKDVNFSSASAPPNERPECAAADELTPWPARGEDHSVVQALCTGDMLLLLLVAGLGIGSLLTAVDNVGQIGQSLGYTQGAISMSVSLLSLSNYAGRVIAGVVSDWALRRHKAPRPLALAVVNLLAAGGHLSIAVGTRGALYAASTVAGFCLGAHWPVLFAVISELFGIKNFSTLYNLAAPASAVGSYILGVQVAGRLYSREALRQHGHRDCTGRQCFRVAFLINAGVAAMLGATVSLVVASRTREFYTKLAASAERRYQDGPAANMKIHSTV
ncbi:hypothetical protein ACP4OV_011897 [Aristida adscensionis]